jgi:hypothetical protein
VKPPQGFQNWDEYDAYRKATGPSMRPSYPGLFTEAVATNPVTQFLVPGAEKFLQRGGRPSMWDVGLSAADLATPLIPIGPLAGVVRRKSRTGLKHIGYKDRPDEVPTVTRWISEGVSDAPLDGRVRFHYDKNFFGEKGNKRHLTKKQVGFVPPERLRDAQGASGEIRGEHRNMASDRWEPFKKDTKEHGIEEPILVGVEPSGDSFKTVIIEGNHRLDSALELGLDKIPVEVHYFGKTEDFPIEIFKNKSD